MTDFKPKNINEVIKDIIGSALNDNSTFYEDEMGRCSDNYIPAENFDKVEDDILENLKDNKYIDIEFIGRLSHGEKVEMLNLENKNLKEQIKILAKVIKKGMRICNNLGIDLNELEGE